MLRNKNLLPLALGNLLYLLYVLKIGGDFMSGRFFTAPFFCSIVALSQLNFSARSVSVAALSLAVLGITSHDPPILSGADYGKGLASLDKRMRNRGIGDERSRFYPTTGLLPTIGGIPLAQEPGAIEGRRLRAGPPPVYIARGIGFVGYYAGPQVHIVDLNALSDPLLARLPPVKAKPLIAHFARRPPDGYLRSVRTGRNYVIDENLRLYYDKLRIITRGSIWDTARFAEI